MQARTCVRASVGQMDRMRAATVIEQVEGSIRRPTPERPGHQSSQH